MGNSIEEYKDFIQDATRTFSKFNLLDKYHIVTNWPNKSAFGNHAIGLEPVKFKQSPSTLHDYDYDPDIIFFKDGPVFAYSYAVVSPQTRYEPEFSDYLESKHTFDSLSKAVNDYIQNVKPKYPEELEEPLMENEELNGRWSGNRFDETLTLTRLKNIFKKLKREIKMEDFDETSDPENRIHKIGINKGIDMCIVELDKIMRELD